MDRHDHIAGSYDPRGPPQHAYTQTWNGVQSSSPYVGHAFDGPDSYYSYHGSDFSCRSQPRGRFFNEGDGRGRGGFCGRQQDRRYSNRRWSPYPNPQSPRSHRYDSGSDVDGLIDGGRSRASEFTGAYFQTASPAATPARLNTVRSIPDPVRSPPQRITSSPPMKKERKEESLFLPATDEVEDGECSPDLPTRQPNIPMLSSATLSGNQVDSSRDPRIRDAFVSPQQVPTSAKDLALLPLLQSIPKVLPRPLVIEVPSLTTLQHPTSVQKPASESKSRPTTQSQILIVSADPAAATQQRHGEDEVSFQCRALEYQVRQLCSLTYCSEIPAIARIAEVYNTASTHYSRPSQVSPHDRKVIESNLRQVREAKDKHQSIYQQITLLRTMLEEAHERFHRVVCRNL